MYLNDTNLDNNNIVICACYCEICGLRRFRRGGKIIIIITIVPTQFSGEYNAYYPYFFLWFINGISMRRGHPSRSG